MTKRKRQVRKGSDPRCWWCHEPISLEVQWRGHEPSLELPLGAGVVICGPDCPDQPEDAIIFDLDTLTALFN